MLGNKKTIENIIKVSASNMLKLLSGVLVGFLLPKIIGVTDYGYYKTFTLYASYAGLFHFGFADGIYLVFGDKDYEQLNKNDFRFFCQFYIYMEIIISVIIICISFLFLKDEYRFIFLCEALYLLAINITNIYQLISQITKRFTELSLRNVFNSVLTIISLLIMWLCKKYSDSVCSYRLYTIMYVLIIGFLAVWYLYTYRDITFGKKSNLKIMQMGIYFKIGFPLMLSALCTSLILTLDRQFVSLLFDIKTYAVYAFAYSMLNLVSVAIAAISTVLYPTLKRSSDDVLGDSYSNLVAIIQVIVFLCLEVYFPLCFIVNHYLPQYIGSLEMFRIIFPGLAISSSISIVMHNYYKTLGWTSLFFKKSVLILIVSALANGIAYVLFKTPSSISVASILTLLLWYFIVQSNVVKKYHIHGFRNEIYMFLMMILFYLVTAIKNGIVGFVLYLLLFAISTIVIYRIEYIKMKKILLRK